jgi:hypothetical protein
MKLFLIIYAGTQIGGIAGPLPYGMDECEKRRDVFRAAQSEAVTTGYSKPYGRNLTSEELSKIRQIRFECEWRETRQGVPA